MKPINLEFKSIHKHARGRMLKRNISESDTQSFIDNAIVMFVQMNDKRRAFYRENGVSVVELENLELRTCFRKENFDPSALLILEVVKNMVKTFDCPLLKRKINDAYCYEVNMVLAGLIKERVLEDKIDNKEEANKKCDNCDFNQMM